MIRINLVRPAPARFPRWAVVVSVCLALAVLVWTGRRLVHNSHPQPHASVAVQQRSSPAVVSGDVAGTPATLGPPAAASAPAAPPAQPVTPAAVRLAVLSALAHSTKREFTAIELALDRPVAVHSEALRNPDRVYFDLQDTRISDALAPAPWKVASIEMSDGLVSRVRMAQREPTVTRIVLDLQGPYRHSYVMSPSPPYRLVIDVEAPKKD